MTSFKQVTRNAKSTTTGLNNTGNPVTFSVESGHGARFPQPGNGFWVTVWNRSQYADPADDPNMEILLVTSRTNDSLTANRAQLGTSNVAHPGTVDVRLLVQAENFSELHTAVNVLEVVGQVVAYAGESAPTGWLLCDGSAVSRTTYASLFNVIGETYGEGDGSTTFNLPNLKGRVPVGVDNGQAEFDTLAKTGGAKTHTLTLNEMPSHTHIQNSHSHGFNHGKWNAGSFDPSTFRVDANSGANHWAGETAGATATNQNTGGGAAHNNLQPYLVLNYIIKT